MSQNAYDFLLEDPTIKDLVIKYKLPILSINERPLYESLIKAIVSQQLSVKAADTIYGRFVNLFDKNILKLNQLVTLDHDTLRGVGLSNQKAVYVKNVATYFLDTSNSTINWMELSDKEIVEKLLQIKGVGAWTVQMILIFNLGRQDVLPLGDLIVRKGLINVLNIKTDDTKTNEKITQRSKKWSPYRSYVSRLMWAAKDDVIKF